MLKRVKIFGLQRSGTKYIEELIRQNLIVEVDYHGSCTLGWKHALPNESWISLELPDRPIDLIKIEPNLLVLLVRKEREKWLASINKRRSDIQRRPELNPWSDKAALDLWDRFYADWFATGLCQMVDYKDVLGDYAGFLESLEGRYGLKRKKEFHDIEKVPFETDGWSLGRRLYYLD